MRVTLSKAETSKRDLDRRRTDAARAGEHFSVRYSLDGKPHDPPRFFRTIEEARVEAETTLGRLSTAQGADVHARPDDVKKAQVWVEHLARGAWTIVDSSVGHGHLDTAKCQAGALV